MLQFHLLFLFFLFNLDNFGLYSQAKSYQTNGPNKRLKREEKFSYRAEKYKQTHTKRNDGVTNSYIGRNRTDGIPFLSFISIYVYIWMYIYLKSTSNYNYRDTNEESKELN